MLNLITFLSILLNLHSPMQQQPDDRHQIEQVYNQLCRAMIAKDTALLNTIHADEYVLYHMTGMKQTKQEYIDAIADGTLNYFSAEHDKLDITVNGDQATLDARSRVAAAVFGGGRHTWRLRCQFTLKRQNGHWLITSSRASTY
jgi:ketosteroid isomerase-like protein